MRECSRHSGCLFVSGSNTRFMAGGSGLCVREEWAASNRSRKTIINIVI